MKKRKGYRCDKVDSVFLIALEEKSENVMKDWKKKKTTQKIFEVQQRVKCHSVCSALFN